jgi:penicillin-binding protein 1A
MFRWTTAILLSVLVLALAGAGAVLAVLWHFGRSLPDYQQLADYEPPTVTRVHAGDGRLLAEFAREKRVFVPIAAMPKRVIKAFIAAEDKNFYSHPGIDFMGVARAVVTNLSRLGSNSRPVGASTITQQVAKNFLLTNEVSIERKVKEAILAFRIERALSKDRILELYLNEIYLGYGSYGVAAAALNYFNKALDDLSVSELAFLAGLPKAPNNYNPARRPAAAKARRDYVIGRMQEDGYLTAAQAAEARAAPLEVRRRDDTVTVDARYFAEDVRRELIRRYGEKGLYGGGLSVRTTVDPGLQALADATLRDGLIEYDRRHGWRGPVARLKSTAQWETALANVERPMGVAEAMPHWRLAVVLDVADAQAAIGVESGAMGFIPLSELKWARAWKEGQRRGGPVKKVGDVLAPGDVVLVMPAPKDKDGKPAPEGAFALQQVPEIQGGLVAMDPHTGRVLAMSGGFSYGQSEFNRATQARRQPGSAFKPFVYLAALDAGFTPSSLVLDAPFVIDQGPGQGRWKPSNYSNKFYGPSPMRVGIERSRNLMTVRLAQNIGINTVADYAEKFRIVEKLPRMLSMALGAAETTLMDMTTAYAMLVNGGKRVTPTLIDRVQDRHGRTVFRHEQRPCAGCRGVAWQPDAAPPAVPDNREQVADPRSAYQIVSMLESVVERGTGRRIRVVGKPLAGKTGTTNDSLDAWFIGFAPDLAVGVFTGFDNPRSLGRGETGSSVAVPVFRDFMEGALKNRASIPFRIPPGLRLVRVNADTGLPARPGDRHVILEAFRPGTEPTAARAVLDGSAPEGAGVDPLEPAAANRGRHGLY